MKYSFVIPCYNSSKTVLLVVEEIKDTMKEESFEIILVNDYSVIIQKMLFLILLIKIKILFQ